MRGRRLTVSMALLALALAPVNSCTPATVTPAAVEAVEALPAGGHVYVVGASVTRLSAPSIRTRIPDAIINAVDGRSMIHPDNRGGPTVMEVIRGWLPYLRGGDWLVVEAAHGGVDVATNQRYMHEVIRLVADSVCIAWVIPATYYGAPTPETVRWNTDMEAMIRSELPGQPCHAVIPWGDKVRSDWLINGFGYRLVYDGRHPTSPAGTWWYAKLMADAVL
jgi:hypothetical protein